MKLENWKRNSGVVRLFLDTLEDDNKKKQMLLGTLDIGDEQETDEMRTLPASTAYSPSAGAPFSNSN